MKEQFDENSGAGKQNSKNWKLKRLKGVFVLLSALSGNKKIANLSDQYLSAKRNKGNLLQRLIGSFCWFDRNLARGISR